jgi:hypothetical protein
MALAPKRYFRKLAFLAKIETDYGVSSAPTGAADAMLIKNVTFTPLAADEIKRELYLPWLGHQGLILVGEHTMIEFDVELSGAGAAGDVPGYGPLLRVCGLAETVTAGVKVEYEPVSAGYEALTGFFNLDGVNHAMLGVRGTVSPNLSAKGLPVFRFQMWGLLGPIADVALPAAVLTAFQTPLPVNKINTTLALHGFTAVAESLQLALGNQVEGRFLIGEDSIQIVNRESTGTAVVEARSVATIDWITRARQRTRGVLAAQHGTVAGNIVKLDGAAVEVGKPTYGQSQGIVTMSIPLVLCPDAGDDELMITVQ